MSAIPAPMQSAIRAFAPPISAAERVTVLEAECRRMAKLLERWQQIGDAAEELLRLPFEIEVETRAAVTNAEPDFCSEAEYTTVAADESIVRDAVDWLIDKHMRELEAEVIRRQHEAWRCA